MDKRTEQISDIGNAAVREQASEWFLALQNDPDNLDMKEAFSVWLAADESHEDAWVDVLMTWQALDDLKDDAELEHILMAKQTSATSVQTSATKVTGSRSARYWGATMVVGLLLVIALVPEHLWHNADHYTVAAQQQVIKLEDGSILHLGPASAVNVSYDAQARHIELLYGEAFFEVAKAPEHPFSVTAESVQATALGTAFNMRIQNDSVTTTLTEGRLQIDANNHNLLQMTAGQRMHWQASGDYQLQEGRFDYWPSWKRQLLRIDEMSLAEVVGQLNRHYDIRFQVVDPRLSDKKLRGVLPLNDLDTALLVIESALKVKLVRISDGLIVLYKKS